MPRDTTELEAMLLALNRSAERLQALWLSFIGLSIYFILTSLTTTHRMLLLEEHQTLPLVNLKVPLLPFYFIAPLFYIAIHFYMLLMLVLLARSAAAFEAMLRDALPIDSDRERFRMRLENTLFLQLLSGARSERKGINGLFLAALALITTAMTPCATLLVMQLQFLPYHSVGITWLHRAAVLLDLMLVWFLWRGYRHRWGRPLPRSPWSLWRQRSPRWWLRGPLFLTGRFLALFVVIWMSLVEGRWAGEPWIDPLEDNVYVREAGIELPISNADALYLEDRRLEPKAHSHSYQSYGLKSGIDTWSLWRLSVKNDGVRPLLWLGLFKDRLSLRSEMIVGSARMDETRKEALRGPPERFLPTWDFRGRDFTGADFTEADLRGVDFRLLGPDDHARGRTILRRAILNGALLDEARFDGADMAKASLERAHANGAWLNKVNLSSANLTEARLNGAKIANSNLTCASLERSLASAVDFSASLMSGIRIDRATIDGALLYSVTMPLAEGTNVSLDGTKIAASEVQGSTFFPLQASAFSFFGNYAYSPDIGFYVASYRFYGDRVFAVKTSLILNNDETVTARKQPLRLFFEDDYFKEKAIRIDKKYVDEWFDGTDSDLSDCGRNRNLMTFSYEDFLPRPIRTRSRVVCGRSWKPQARKKTPTEQNIALRWRKC